MLPVPEPFSLTVPVEYLDGGVGTIELPSNLSAAMNSTDRFATDEEQNPHEST